jgi:hypothetical protein
MSTQIFMPQAGSLDLLNAPRSIGKRLPYIVFFEVRVSFEDGRMGIAGGHESDHGCRIPRMQAFPAMTSDLSVMRSSVSLSTFLM